MSCVCSVVFTAPNAAGERRESVETLVEDMDTQVASTPQPNMTAALAAPAAGGQKEDMDTQVASTPQRNMTAALAAPAARGQKDAMETPAPNKSPQTCKTDITMACAADDAAGPTPTKLEARLEDATAGKQKDGDERYWSKDSGWWRDWQDWGRSWSSTEWNYMPGKEWSAARGYSRELEYKEHEGWKGEGDSEQEHAKKALQRQTTSLEDQHRPSEAPNPAQDAPTPAQDAPDQAQDAPNAAQDAPSNAAQNAPNAAQDAPNVAQAPNQAQDAPNQAQDAPRPVQAIKQEDDGPPGDEQDPDAWRKDKKGNYLKPHALYMRFYRSIHRQTLKPATRII